MELREIEGELIERECEELLERIELAGGLCTLIAKGHAVGNLEVMQWALACGRGLHSSTFQLNLSRF